MHGAVHYRLIQGDTLMRKVLADGFCALGLLLGAVRVDPRRVGLPGRCAGSRPRRIAARLALPGVTPCRSDGRHAVTPERFEAIVEWMISPD